MAEESKKKRSPREVLEAIERMAEDDELAVRIGKMSEAELDRDIREHGGDPEAIAARAKELVDRLAKGEEPAAAPAPTRMAAGMPLRQALLAILAEAARDPRKKALLEEELGGKSVDEATDEDLARAVTRVRGG